MELKITAKNIKLTDAIKNYAESRVNRLDKFFSEGSWAQLVLSVDKKINQKAEITIHGAKKKIASKAIKQDLYKAIEEAVAKIETQVKKKKAKEVKGKKVSKNVKEDLSAYFGNVFAAQADVKFSVIKQVEVHPMNPEDAAYEMERLGYTFWMFMDEDSKQINLIFKRLDGTYGLIQPVKIK